MLGQKFFQILAGRKNDEFMTQLIKSVLETNKNVACGVNRIRVRVVVGDCHLLDRILLNNQKRKRGGIRYMVENWTTL